MAVPYNPQQFISDYEKLAPGKSKISGIRAAVAAADEEKDIPYQIFFRCELCRESTYFGDALDNIITLPQLLTLIDENPDVPCAEHAYYSDTLRQILHIYKWFLYDSMNFYQISRADFEFFLEDYRQRCVAYGDSLKDYYRLMYSFYRTIDKNNPKAEQYFHLYESLPLIENSECKACERNTIIRFYLEHDDLNKAVSLAADIESHRLSCGHGTSYLMLHQNYFNYYMRKKEYQQAEYHLKLMQMNHTLYTDHDFTTSELLYYSYFDIAKALKIYKAHWKNFFSERNAAHSFEFAKTCCVFFQLLMQQRKRQTIKIAYDASFPLYRETNSYRILELYNFYYKFTEELASKFDTRNQTQAFHEELQQAIEEANIIQQTES